MVAFDVFDEDFRRLSLAMGPVADSFRAGMAQVGESLRSGVGARLTHRTVCSSCGGKILAGDAVMADLAGDLEGTWHHTDCSDPKLEMTGE